MPYPLIDYLCAAISRVTLRRTAITEGKFAPEVPPPLTFPPRPPNRHHLFECIQPFAGSPFTGLVFTIVLWMQYVSSGHSSKNKAMFQGETKDMMRRSFSSLWALILFAILVWERTAKAQDGNVDQRCLPTELKYPRIDPRPTSITVSWRLFEPLPDCVKKGAEYTIHIAWTTEHGQPHKEQIPVQRDKYEITGLSPYVIVDIDLSLHYKDENGNEYSGNGTNFHTRARVGSPTPPRNMRVTEVRHDGTILEWEAPEAPNGPLDGYEYRICSVETCAVMPYIECAGSSETRELRLLAKDLTPLGFYWVWLAAFNQDYIVRKKVIGGYASVCFKAPPHALQPVRNLQAKCTSPNTIDMTWKLPLDAKDIPEGYRLEVVRAAVGGYEEDDKGTHEVDIKASCRGEDCTYSVQGLKGGVDHNVQLYPHYKDVGPFGASVGFGGCLVRPAPPTKEIKLINDPMLNKTEQAFEMPLDLFSNIIGIAHNTRWIIGQDTEIGRCEEPVTWQEAYSHDPIKCYAVEGTENDGSPLCENKDNVARCVIGNQDLRDCLGYHCNGPLKVGVKYGFMLRAHYSASHYVDSKPAFFTAGTPISGSDGRRKGSVFVIGGLTVLASIMLSGGNTI